MNYLDYLKIIFDNLIFIYAVIICLSYTVLAMFSARLLYKYFKTNSFVDYTLILTSPFAPSISMVAASFNESKTIVDNIRALLSLHYNNYEVIIVNDGSTDDSMEKIIRVYEMEKVDYAVNYRLKTQVVRGVYKSKNKSYSNLVVVDKENGGKADALNAGINISCKDYFVAIDVDCIIQPDALLKLVKPILDSGDRRVIATGGVIRIANSCIFQDGYMVDINLPKNIWARFQVLEYTRAFLMGRMAWSELNGLLIISGALGLFDRELTIQCGGYLTDTVGEDMELVVKIRKTMWDNGIKHHVAYVPDPLCWTEAPTNLKLLGRQRDRWTRGNMETLFIHRKMFFNPKYGKLGMLAYPYWFFFEWLAPIIEFLGISYVLILALVGDVNWPFFLLMLCFIYAFAVTFSIWALLYEEVTFQKYKHRSDLFKLILVAFIEPFIYHPLGVFWALHGNISYIRGVKKWGKMERTGFRKKK